ncbi:DEAD/DEAH box helicase [Rhodococcus fascians]|nr:DEAD/DEAH box helicase [Rhodococcus fascians]MBY4429477.1 DEAD/DEAH box helicase [Rhodococcus fascians]
MERSLDLTLLSGALGGRTDLPTAEQLQQLMADVEVQLFLRQPQLDQQLFDAAWYLHGVASVSAARERYTLARQRQAFLVSAHIFDLALDQEGWTRTQRLSFGFAAAIGYRRGGRDPNATAIMNQLRGDIDTVSPIAEHIDTLATEVGLAFLGFETRTLFRWLGVWRRQLAALATNSELPDLTTTFFGTTHMVVLGAEDMLHYLARGDTERLQRGLNRLYSAATGAAGPAELNARWVAAHLFRFSGDARAGSLWDPNVLPPSVPSLVRQAFTLGNPPVLTLWEPQRDLFTGDRSPFDDQVRRMVLAVPTSGGKTLIAQMLAVEHLARTNRSVCYVAPTRSLGREVRKAMSSRVRILQKEAGADKPDFPSSIWDILDVLDSEDSVADVEVMTPERLGHMLRHDAQSVIDRFGMFIFDEAQFLRDSHRGFTLESVISLLDYLTRDSHHQLVLISAAMGNVSAIAQWLGPNDACLQHESDWRGPRRLHAAFTTRADFSNTQVEVRLKSPVWKYIHTTKLAGTVRLRMADGRTSTLSTQEDTGWTLVRLSKDGGQYPEDVKKDSARSTKHYEIAADMITTIGHAGSVLAVASTRADSQRLATALAATCDEQPATAPLADFVQQQLGEHHPLVGVLRRGVGFHHAGLPVEVLEAVEEAIRDDTLQYLTSTSTITDGVNLPVRTVVIYDNSYPGQPEDSTLRGARLVNAMGRAGRAGKETEGWIVLVRAAEPTEQDFRDLSPAAADLATTSSMITDEALDAFAQLEAQLRTDEDAIFTASDKPAEFISFVWLMLSIEEGQGIDPSEADLDRIIGSTLAAQQSGIVRTQGIRIGEATRRRYTATDPEARQRWPRTGTSIGSARKIDGMAHRIAATIIDREHSGTMPEVGTPREAIRRLSRTVDTLLALPEAPPWNFRASSHGDDINVAPIDLLSDWIAGHSFTDLADAHLVDATNPAWRIEQMVLTVTAQCEHYLSWTVGALVELVNARLEDADAETRLCPELGGCIRYGVDTTAKLLLMSSGIRSRRLAHLIAASITNTDETTVESLREHLGEMSINTWRIRYDATSSELTDLLEFTRLRGRSLLKKLLETNTITLELANTTRRTAMQSSELALMTRLSEIPQPRSPKFPTRERSSL